jgi:glycosyltransferase involved in cell wall biosynthesis
VTPPGDVAAFANAVAVLLDNPQRLLAMSVAARMYTRLDHDLPDAARRLDAILTEACAR